MSVRTNICHLFTLAVYSWLISRGIGLELDNGIAVDPVVICGMESTTLSFSSRRPFQGRVFVKGHSQKDGCFSDSTVTHFGSNEGLTDQNFTVQYESCNVLRERTANPRGVAMETTLVVQFHPVFITKVDRAYKVRCFYAQTDQKVTASLDISQITTVSISDQYPMPDCSYTIRQNTFDGPEVELVRVGDPIFHRWDCEGPHVGNSAYGMLIHTCFVRDGQGHEVMLIDENGCGIDPYILGHLTYSNDLVQAYREAHAFKFADINVLMFTCQVRLCFKSMGTCQGMTPPRCAPLKNKKKRSLRYVFEQVEHSVGSTTELLADLENSFDLTAKRLLVLDHDEGPDMIPRIEDVLSLRDSSAAGHNGSVFAVERRENLENFFCFPNKASLYALVLLFISAATIALLSGVALIRQRRTQMWTNFKGNEMFFTKY